MAKNQDQHHHQNKMSKRESHGLLPGLPDDLAIQCLARVPSLSLLWRVSVSWRSMVSESVFFHSLRVKLGFKPQKWIYALLYEQGSGSGHGYGSSCAGYGAFSWHAYDPLANKWHALPPLPQPVDFQITSPDFIGLTHAVQCVSSETKLFMVAGSSRSGSRATPKPSKISAPENSMDNQKYGCINSVSKNGHGYATVALKPGSERKACVDMANIRPSCGHILQEIGKNCVSERIHAYVDDHKSKCMRSVSEDLRCGYGSIGHHCPLSEVIPENEMVDVSSGFLRLGRVSENNCESSTSKSSNSWLESQEWKSMNSVIETRKCRCDESIKALIYRQNLPKIGKVSGVEDGCSSTEWQDCKCVNSVTENGYSFGYQGLASKKLRTEYGARVLAKTNINSASESTIPLWLNSELGDKNCEYSSHVHAQRSHNSSVGCRSLFKSSKHFISQQMPHVYKNKSCVVNSTSMYWRRTNAHEAKAGPSTHRPMLIRPENPRPIPGNSSTKLGSENAASEDAQRLPLKPALDCPFIFDTETWTWKLGLPYTVPRRWCACGIVSDENLIVASGCGKDWDLSVSKSAEMYDSKAGKWTPLENLKSSKFSGEAINAVNYGGKLYMVSGKGVFWKVGVIFDPWLRTWTNMPRGMRDGWNGPSVVVDDNLYVLEDAIGRLKRYKSSDDSWVNAMEDKKLMNLDQLTSGVSGKFCGIFRPTTNSDTPNQCFELNQKVQPLSSTTTPPSKEDVIRIVDVSGNMNKWCVIRDVPVPFGQIVSLQVLSRCMIQS